MSTGANGNTHNNSGSNDKDTTVVKSVGIVEFSGIAMSILKALNPFNINNENNSKSCHKSIPSLPKSKSLPLQEPTKKPTINHDEKPKLSVQTIEIERGDTFWGLSRKYGVSINAIKKANGLIGNTIYTRKKLVIP